MESRLEKMKETALRHALDVAAEQIVKEGGSEFAALQNLEQDWIFMFDGKGRVFPYFGEGNNRVAALGASDDAIRYLARQYHLHNVDKLGGNPTPLGNEKPKNEIAAEAEEERQRKANAAREREQQREEQREEFKRQRAIDNAQGEADRHERIVSTYL